MPDEPKSKGRWTKMTAPEMEHVIRETERSIPTLQMEDGPLTEEQKARELGYLRKVLIEEERRNSQVIPLPEDVAPLSPPVVAVPSPAIPHEKPERWTRSDTGIMLTLVVGCLAIGVFFLFRFVTGDGPPTSGDLKLAGAGLLVVWVMAVLNARFDEIKARLDAIEKRLSK
jgi:hypothetical protein